MKVGRVSVDHLAERHALLGQLLREHLKALLYLGFLDVIIDLALYKLANLANLDPLLSHFLRHV